MDTSPSDVWRQWAADLSAELGVLVTWTPLGFYVDGLTVTSPEAVRAIAGRSAWTPA
jgi:hypothetical protein